MIVNSEEYYKILQHIKDYNSPSIVPLQPDSIIMNIDLNSRIIEAPEYLSVEEDHLAETVYFRLDRFYDNQDLANTVGIIQYINGKGDGYIYPIPYYDIATEKENNKILFPWCIEGHVTEKSGVINFSIKFYDIENEEVKYILNTLPAKSKVAKGLEVSNIENNPDYSHLLSIADQLIAEVQNIKRQDLYWIILD